MRIALGSTRQPKVEQSKTPLPASSDIGAKTLMAERSRRSANGNKKLTSVSDQKCRAVRLGAPTQRKAHWEVVAKA